MSDSAAAEERQDGEVPRKRSLPARVYTRLPQRHVLAAVAGQAFASGTNFLTGVILARALAKEEYGLYYLGFTLVIFVIELQNALISTPYMVYAPRLGDEEHRRYTGSTLVYQLGLSAIVMAVVLGAAVVLSLGAGPEGAAPVAWSMLFVVGLVTLRDFTRRVCFANLRMAAAFCIDASVAVLQLGTLFVLGWLGVLSAGRAWWVIGLATGGISLAWLWMNRHMFNPRLRAALQDLRGNWSFGKWVFLSGVLWGLSMNSYPWLVSFFKGAAAAGVWGACFTLVGVGNILMLGVQNFLGPKIARVYAEEGPHALRRFVFIASGLFAVPLLLFSGVFWFFGDFMLTFIWGNSYSGNGWVLALLAFNLLAIALAFAFSRGLFAIERADVDFLVNFVVLFVLIALGIWLVRAHGVLGAACALLTANLAALVVRALAFLRCLPSPGEVSA